MTTNVGDVVRISCRMRWEVTDDVTNVFHFLVQLQDEPNDTAFMGEVATLLDGIYTGLEALQPTGLTANIIEGKNITQNILLPATTWPTYAGGTDVGNSAPPQTSPFSYYPTIKPRTQGRTFWPLVAETASGNGRLTVGAQAAHETAALNIQTGLGTVTVLLAYIVFNNTFGTWVTATTAVTPVGLRTQRRRRPGVGS